MFSRGFEILFNFKKRMARTLAARYSIAHPDLCWICFDLDLKCHHVASRWSELVRQLQETVYTSF
jgi:hypothetical protein